MHRQPRPPRTGLLVFAAGVAAGAAVAAALWAANDVVVCEYGPVLALWTN